MYGNEQRHTYASGGIWCRLLEANGRPSLRSCGGYQVYLECEADGRPGLYLNIPHRGYHVYPAFQRADMLALSLQCAPGMDPTPSLVIGFFLIKHFLFPYWECSIELDGTYFWITIHRIRLTHKQHKSCWILADWEDHFLKNPKYSSSVGMKYQSVKWVLNIFKLHNKAVIEFVKILF